MLSSIFFGAVDQRPPDPPVGPGHRGIDVLIDGQLLRVDVDVLAEASGLFLQVQSTSAAECPLEDFPGGITIFRQIVCLLTNFADQTPLQVTDENVLNLFEAAWLLECPRIFDVVMDSPYMRSLSSRRMVELLEHLLPFTAASSPMEGQGLVQDQNDDSGNSVSSSAATEEFMRVLVLETTMWQRTEQAALELATQLDGGDLVLGPRLATGSLRMCCELLRLYQRREFETGFMSSALQPVSAIWKNLTDKPLRAQVSWDSHYFALHCMRKRLQSDSHTEESGGNSLAGEHEEDEEARADIPDALCENISDSTLLGLVELVQYVDIHRAPRNWTALLIRTLLLSNRTEEARQAFAESFASSPRVQELAWKNSSAVPVAWLSDVAQHVEASRVLLRILGNYREMDANDFCDVIEGVLLERFLPSPHCKLVVLASELMNDIVGSCFDAGRKARAPRYPEPAGADDNDGRESKGHSQHDKDKDNQNSNDGNNTNTTQAASTNTSNMTNTTSATNIGNVANTCNTISGSSVSSSESKPGTIHVVLERRCPSHWAGQHVLWRLHHVGIRLFAAAFVPQCGFLPHAWPDSNMDYAGDTNQSWKDKEHVCRIEPLVIKVTGNCLWDESLLTIELLHPIMDSGRAAQHEPILHFGRQVIMRHLWYRHDGTYYEIPQLKSLWELACWPLCEDAGLIREALEYLKGTYRELQALGAGWCPEYEEALFQMFVALDLLRLPGQALLSPWVPSQVQTVRLLVQQQPAEQFHAELQQEVVTAMESLKCINLQCAKLSNKLNIVEQRTVINKSQINDSIGFIEEHQRKKREAALPPRRMSAIGALQ